MFLETVDQTDHYRFGQAFCNYFEIKDPELFYCVDDEEAGYMIFRKYIRN